MDSGLEYSTKGLQTVCPIGIESFDDLIGGGFALTSINIIDEDQYQIYSSMILKAYVTSAIYSKQNLLIFSPNITSKKCRFFKELPSLQTIKTDPLEGGKMSPAKDYSVSSKMKIAFRYSNLPSRFSDSDYGQNKFDFGNHLDEFILDESHIEFYKHKDIISVLKDKIQTSKQVDSVCRVWIDQLGSPTSSLNNQTLPKIIHQLKILMRHLTKSVCLINVISSTFDQESFLLPTLIRQRLYFQADSVIKLVAFDQDDQKNPYSKDYAALVQLLRLPRLNSLAPYNPMLESTEYGLKLHSSKKFIHIEKLSLPPDLGEMVNRFTSSVQAADNLESSSSKLTDF